MSKTRVKFTDEAHMPAPIARGKQSKDHIAQEVHDHKERTELTRNLTRYARRCLFGGPR